MLFITTFIKKFKISFINVAHGILIGSSILIPGLSGGTTAILLGIYNDIIEAVDTLFSNFVQNVKYLLSLGVGSIIGFYICSFPLKIILDHYYFEFSYFVIGIILGSIPLFFKTAKGKAIKNISLIICGIIFTLSIDFVSSMTFGYDESTLMLILIGLLSSIALILPGISLSYILIAFGYYSRLIIAINQGNYIFIIKFGTVLIIGILILARILDRAYKKYPVSFNMLILGMVIASIKQVFIKLPMSGEIVICLLLFCGGLCGTLFLNCFKKFANVI